jgi:hypothetical protein
VNAILLVDLRQHRPPGLEPHAPESSGDREFRHGGAFQLVYPNPSDDAAAIARHLKEYGYPPSIGAADPAHTLVNSVGATITPEAAVLDADRRLIYRGRIDDRFVELGRERPKATTHDLREALMAALAGKPVKTAVRQAVGCFIADMRPR